MVPMKEHRLQEVSQDEHWVRYICLDCGRVFWRTTSLLRKRPLNMVLPEADCDKEIAVQVANRMKGRKLHGTD